MSRKIRVGNVFIGGGSPVSIQSMTTTDTKDVESTVSQIRKLKEEGADLVRVAVPDIESAKVLKFIKEKVNVPIIADVHFDHRIAIEAIKNGADKVRINPGNIGPRWKVEELAKVAKDHGVPIRVGSNTGSIPKRFEKYDRVRALVESALEQVGILESVGFHDIVVSVKSTDVLETIKANEMISEMVDYPIHLGVTEAGIYETAIVKSSIAIGHLLMRGIGDTIRVSIAGDPVVEVRVARKILISLGLREGVEVIACPMCSRAVVDVEKIATEIERKLSNVGKNLKFAILGCYVNGIGEGKSADVGIAGIDGRRFIAFKRGKVVGEFDSRDIWRVVDDLVSDI